MVVMGQVGGTSGEIGLQTLKLGLQTLKLGLQTIYFLLLSINRGCKRSAAPCKRSTGPYNRSLSSFNRSPALFNRCPGGKIPSFFSFLRPFQRSVLSPNPGKFSWDSYCNIIYAKFQNVNSCKWRLFDGFSPKRPLFVKIRDCQSQNIRKLYSGTFRIGLTLSRYFYFPCSRRPLPLYCSAYIHGSENP